MGQFLDRVPDASGNRTDEENGASIVRMESRNAGAGSIRAMFPNECTPKDT
jgi:hypothetical protein